MVCPLITKSDGIKFGKTEQGNVWLDPRYTSPYKFYQFWLNVSDEDAERYIKIFTVLNKEDIATLVEEQKQAPHLRPLQKALAKEVTCMVHSEEEYQKAVEASDILFGKATFESLAKLDEDTFLAVFEGVPQFDLPESTFNEVVNVVELMTTIAPVFKSKGELRKLITGGGISINKEKIADAEVAISSDKLLNGKYLLAQKGEKDYYILKVQ